MKSRSPRGLFFPWALLVALAVSLSAASVNAEQTLSQDEKLSAIRQGLLQAAMDGPTKVQSTVWIDAQGALQESSSFRTGMLVRGVRVMSYERDSQGQPVADLGWQAHSGNPQVPIFKASNPALCKAVPSGRLQHVVGLTVSVAPQWTSDDLPVIRSLEDYLFSQWQGAASAAVVWRLAMSPRKTRSMYADALLGSSADQLPWQARLSLRPLTKIIVPVVAPHDSASAELLVPGPSPEAMMQLDLSITARNQYEPLFEAHSLIKWRIDRPNWEAPRLSEESQALLTQQLQSWAQDVRQRMSCEPVLPEVILSSRDTVRINAGALAGVRVGDEWLLANGKDYMQYILEPGVAAQSVLAKVQTVSQHHAQLQVIAGPQTTVQRGWRAWSTEELR